MDSDVIGRVRGSLPLISKFVPQDYRAESGSRATQTVISLKPLPSGMDDDTRQKLISLFLVLLMITSGIAYAASFF